MTSPRSRRSSFSDSGSDSDHKLNMPRKQSLSLGVTHCRLPNLMEEEEEQEDTGDEEQGRRWVERREGCWGWVVVVASFLCLCVLDGVGYIGRVQLTGVCRCPTHSVCSWHR